MRIGGRRLNIGVAAAMAEAIDDIALDKPTSLECDEGRHEACLGGYGVGPSSLTPQQIARLPLRPCRCACGHPHLRSQ